MYYNNFMDMKKIFKELFSYVKIIVITWVSIYIFTNFLFRPVIVEGRSMYPTLHDKDMGFSNIIGVKLDGIKRFDIVVIKPNASSDLIVKRVIGLPGETVEYRNDKLYIDGEYLAEFFLDNEYFFEYTADGKLFTIDFKYSLKEGEYYCLGDNRPRSSDSRVIGPIKISQIVSKSVIILYPFSDFLKGK